MGHHVTSWDTMGHYGTPWDIMGHHGTSWDTMGHHGTPWDIMGHHGTSWDTMGHHGTPCDIVCDATFSRMIFRLEWIFLSPKACWNKSSKCQMTLLLTPSLAVWHLVTLSVTKLQECQVLFEWQLRLKLGHIRLYYKKRNWIFSLSWLTNNHRMITLRVSHIWKVPYYKRGFKIYTFAYH